MSPMTGMWLSMATGWSEEIGKAGRGRGVALYVKKWLSPATREIFINTVFGRKKWITQIMLSTLT